MSNLLFAPLEWSTEKRKVKELIPYEYNPRRLTDDKKEKLKASLEKFNLAEIPAINTDNVVIAGHQRIVVLMELGRGEDLIDVRVPNRALTEEEFKEYNIRSNVAIGEWDVDILNEVFQDIDLMALGLNVDDIVLPEDTLPDALKNEKEEDFEPVVPAEPISVTGDVYEFKSVQKQLVHRLICGDSREPDVYSNLLQGENYNLIVTDPPYNINYEGGTKDRMKILNDNMKSEQFYSFLLEFYSRCFENSLPGAPIYVFHADTEGVNFRKAFADAGYKLAQCLIWVKNSIVLGRQDYQWKHEPCLFGERPEVPEEAVEHEPVLYGWKEGAAHKWYSDRKQSTILEFARPTRSKEHPTMKPVDMIVYLIKNSSRQRDIVGDSFSGSGTTLIGCEQSWRNARVIELDPRFVDVNVRRWVKYMRDNHLEYQVTRNGVLMTRQDLDRFFDE
ncbi:DNA modification methylase [Flavobacterium beibuense]|uniref:DNA modification methylase n=1 Tax=Flavobacterium beibuense TaxID=657326 RepID=UPI003A8D78CF